MSLIDYADHYGIDPETLVLSPVILESIFGTNRWLLYEDVWAEWVDRYGRQRFVYKKGNDTDLASVPALFRGIINPAGPIKDFAVLHDGLYVCRPELVGKAGRIDRAQADWLLYLGCKKAGMSDADCEAVFETVRIGGSIVWHRHDKEFS